MSKVVFLNIPYWGHIMPTIALTAELIRRGEDVLYYTTQPFQQRLAEAGARIRIFPSPVVRDLESFNPSKGMDLLYQMRFALDAPRKIVGWLIDELKNEAPDYIMHDFAALFGRLAAYVTGIPRIVTVPVFCYNEPAFARQYSRVLFRMLLSFHEVPRIAAAIRWYHRQYGIPVTRLLLVFTDYGPLNIVSTSRFFQPWSDRFPDRFVFVGPMLAPFDASPKQAITDEKGLPKVLISFGTIFTSNPRFYRTCIQALAGMDVQVLLVIGDRLSIESLGRLPRNIDVVRFIPLLEVLPSIDCFITHGGMNSVSEAISHNVPLVVVPQSIDQRIVADRIHELRAGIHLRRPTVKGIQEAVHLILYDTSLRDNVATLARSFNVGGGAAAAVDAVFSFKHKHGID